MSEADLEATPAPKPPQDQTKKKNAHQTEPLRKKNSWPALGFKSTRTPSLQPTSRALDFSNGLKRISTSIANQPTATGNGFGPGGPTWALQPSNFRQFTGILNVHHRVDQAQPIGCNMQRKFIPSKQKANCLRSRVLGRSWEAIQSGLAISRAILIPLHQAMGVPPHPCYPNPVFKDR